MNTVRLLKAAAGGCALCVLLSVCGFYGQCAGVRDEVVRLHILANSDTTADQTLKMQVRDAVVLAADGLLDGADDAMEALTITQEQLPRLQAAAQQTVWDAGYSYPVTAELCRMYFTTRTYDTVTLPAGMYDAVRVTIGEGAGQNWWCVMFPPMCVGAATEGALADAADAFAPPTATEGERYIIRFKIVEWIESFFQIFR